MPLLNSRQSPEAGGCECFQHLSEKQVENWTLFQFVHLWNCDQDPECKEALPLAGRVTRDYPKLSVRRRIKEVGMGVRGIGDQRGIRI